MCASEAICYIYAASNMYPKTGKILMLKEHNKLRNLRILVPSWVQIVKTIQMLNQRK